MENHNQILTDAQKALFADVGEADLPPRLPQPWRIVSPNSACLRQGPRHHPDARPATFIGPVGDGRMVLESLEGILVGAEQAWIERKPDFSFVAEHPAKPAEADWRKAEQTLDGKAGHRTPNGNLVVETIVSYWILLNEELQRPTPALFAFAKTGISAGRELMDRASRFRNEKLGIKGYVLGLWEIGAAWEQRNPKFPEYLTPRVKLLGKLGEAGGPSFDQVMLAAQVRQALKLNEPWPPSVIAVESGSARPALTASSPSAPSQPSAQTTSERRRWDDDEGGPPMPPEDELGDPGWQPGAGEVADDGQDHFPI